jgi:hypothetical protein
MMWVGPDRSRADGSDVTQGWFRWGNGHDEPVVRSGSERYWRVV